MVWFSDVFMMFCTVLVYGFRIVCLWFLMPILMMIMPYYYDLVIMPMIIHMIMLVIIMHGYYAYYYVWLCVINDDYYAYDMPITQIVMIIFCINYV